MNQIIKQPGSFNDCVEDPFTHDWYGQEDVRITAKRTDQEDVSLSIEVYDSLDKHWRHIDKGFISDEVKLLPADTSNHQIAEAMKLHYFNAVMNGLHDEYVF
tara:strand:+ start:323 stop:628 length:306 start_codon:yes stop_codon:yes gene_type:complete